MTYNRAGGSFPCENISSTLADATLLISGIKVPLGQQKEEYFAAAAQKCGLPTGSVDTAQVHKVSVDARRNPIVLVYTAAFTVPVQTAMRFSATTRPQVQLLQPHTLLLQQGSLPLAHRPVICGLGPAGLFCAYLLAKQGYRPIVLERGPDIARRLQAVEGFVAGGQFSPNANIQFGEGGAGTFSDGKLTTRIHDPLCETVTRILLQNGAPAEIAVRQKPHIGTDLLRNVIVSIRQEIQRLGGTVLFDTPLIGLRLNGGRLCGVNTGGGELPCEVLVLAPGHSARDTFDMLTDAGVSLSCKPFSVGFRAEHLQSEIEKALYHQAAGHPDLPRGEYQMVSHAHKRGVYTFCMCPGGQVVAACSESDTVVTNGMSMHARDGANANAAVVVSVEPADFGGDPAKAIAFQRRLEQQAFCLGGGNYAAPAQNADSFLEGTARLKIGAVQPSYPRGVQAADLSLLYGQELTGALRAGLADFDSKLKGYVGKDVILTGPETRTSSPVRIPRDPDTLQSVQLAGMYPTGEGAGYAGGIMSAAVDGIRVAQMIIARNAPAKQE